MASGVYNSFKLRLANGSVNLLTDTIKVALLTNAYSFDPDTHVFFSDLTNEAVGTGYVSGGVTLTNKSVTQDNTNDVSIFDADDATFTSVILTARYAVIYKSTGTTSSSPLIACYDFGADKTSTGSDFVIHWNTNGVLTLG